MFPRGITHQHPSTDSRGPHHILLAPELKTFNETTMRGQVSFIICYVLLLKIFFHSGYGFTYTIYDFRCRDVTDLDRLNYISSVSLKECIRQCIRRRGCLSIVYKRLYPVCEMFGVDVSTFTKVNLDTSCAVVRRDDVTLGSAEVSSIVTIYL